MSRLLSYLKSSVGKKQIVALTGLGLSGFVLMHMAGNLLLFCGPEIYNTYSHKLITNPLLIPAEIGLVGIFLVHMAFALSVTVSNRRSRPYAPHGRGAGYKDARFGSSWMIFSGLVVAIFTVLHLITFKYGAHYEAVYQGLVVRDLYTLVFEKLSEPLYFGWYLIALAFLGAHLNHGFSALFQTFGFGSVRVRQWSRLGLAFSVIVTLGFMSQPVLAFIKGVPVK